ncbi:VanZ family protein [Halalkalicoccus jeotgali]|uniref:VanZ-like domain-containing protein n=1 Tax=Halalkalicoccus jeotgali (strain DSM 18796 / CECT 7217 / JCM 14584 / KCTC 4019 / B3) TaxID=795797 RepID=D8J930_HALJB|nr:VanZ family protein [Halalkalicoccus jeotgali]ADJ16299.1 hypothetical protein HacjB3_14590 [Halalkalicoccus jeotgali B3]ELY37033.1 hypothetical protein C497_09828 [Halalkalicoccus jeotgali B3]
MNGEQSIAKRVGRFVVNPVARWTAVAGGAGLLFLGASVPNGALAVLTGLPVPTGPVGTDAWLHFFGYGALAVLLCVALQSGNRPRPFVSAFCGVAGYGVSTELLHAAVPYRTFSTIDIAANVAGAFAGCGAVWIAWVLLGLRSPASRAPRIP